jgi:hypothetical protein
MKKRKKQQWKICVNKKKSSIIHQINKENKQAYKEKIIERNRKAREQQLKAQQDLPPPPKISTPAVQQQDLPNKNKDSDFNEFDNINEDKKSKRVQNYDIEKSK